MSFQIRVTALLTENERELLSRNGPFSFYNYNWKDKTSSNENMKYDYLQETSKKRQISEILQDQKIHHATWAYSEDLMFFTVNFNVYGHERMDQIMEDLRFKGFGSHDQSSIHVLESTAFFCDSMTNANSTYDKTEESQNAFQKFISSVKSRMTVVQIYQNVKNRGELTFDYLCFLVTAAGIATLSLSTNNYAGIVASMLLSPLMNPILAILFGIILHQKGLIKEGLRNLSISVTILVFIGFFFGMICHYINYLEKIVYPTNLMMDRGQNKYILSILLFAIVSAPNLSTALLSNNNSAQIGNAISLSLLPPIVNGGFLFFLSVISILTRKMEYDFKTNATICRYSWLSPKHQMLYFDDRCKLNLDFVLGGCFSIFISFANILVILIIGYFVFKIKKLASTYLLKEDARKFYDKDLKEAYTETTMKTLKAKDPNTVLLRNMIKEYAQMHNKNVDELSKAEKTQFIGDLKQLTHGVTEDSHYQILTGNIDSRNMNDIPNKLKQMEISNKLPIDEMNNLTVNYLTSRNPQERHEMMRYLAQNYQPTDDSTKYKKFKLPPKTLYASKKNNSVGRFEIFTTKDVNMSPMPIINEAKDKDIKFHLAEEN